MLMAGGSIAQTAPHFSPTYAASDGSPYSSVYARTFGAGAPTNAAAPPLVTSAPPVTPPTTPPAAGDSGVVYVIEDGRLLTYRAEDYARGGGRALAGSPLPPASSGAAAPGGQADLSSIADRLYGAPPLDTAAGAVPSEAPAAPIQLVPPGN